MGGETKVGRLLLALVTGALGAQCILVRQFIHGLQPMPRGVSATPWSEVTGAVLMAAAASLLWPRAVRVGAVALATLFLLSVAVLYSPLLVANVKDAADDALHTLGFGAAALVLTGPGRPGSAGRLIFGACMIGFGIMHFVFFEFTANFVPAWIPSHRFWAAFTGAAQIAAGLAVVSGIASRLAAVLAAVMYGSWALILHLPRVVASPYSTSEWTDMLIASGLCAGALLIAKPLLQVKGANAPDAVAPKVS